MERKKVAICLPLDLGLNTMLFGNIIEKQPLSIIKDLENVRLSLREFCMLTREEALLLDGMTPEGLAIIERLMEKYALRMGMSDEELDAYQDEYINESSGGKSFYRLCRKLFNEKPKTEAEASNEKLEETPGETWRETPEEIPAEEKPVFPEESFREHLQRRLHGGPFDGNRMNDLGWQRYQTAREAYLNQPFYVRWFYSRNARVKRAFYEAFAIHEIFCNLAVESATETERWYFEHRETDFSGRR